MFLDCWKYLKITDLDDPPVIIVSGSPEPYTALGQVRKVLEPRVRTSGTLLGAFSYGV
jgi:hypothetical protein